jgi:hypothetical protein
MLYRQTTSINIHTTYEHIIKHGLRLAIPNKMMIENTIKILAITTAMTLITLGASADCNLWFMHSKVVPGTNDCEMRCNLIPIGMDNFMCPAKCDNLCSTTTPTYITDKLTYPNTLKKVEKDLIAKYPLDALKVFRAKNQAENSTNRLFRHNRRNDESDAFNGS